LLSWTVTITGTDSPLIVQFNHHTLREMLYHSSEYFELFSLDLYLDQVSVYSEAVKCADFHVVF